MFIVYQFVSYYLCHNKIIQEDITGDDEPDIREQNIMKRKAIVKYKYDRKSMLWCEVTMDFALSRANIMLSSVVEDLAKRALVWKVPGLLIAPSTLL